MERWFNLGVADGFNLMTPTLPSGLKDFVELIIPELQKRGIFRKGYEGATLREHLDLVPPGSRDRSPQRGNYEEE